MMWPFFSIALRRTRELLPCGLQWRRFVKLFRKPKSKFYWYDFRQHIVDQRFHK
jgi:hypothetical protein